MDLRIDASELLGYANAMAEAPGALRDELTDATHAAALEGVGLAQEYAPVDLGNLAGSISITAAGPLSASYGPVGIVYAAQREYGGTIYGNPWLVFQINGQWIKTHSVTQTGSHYMKKSSEALEPRMRPIFEAAIQRALGRIG